MVQTSTVTVTAGPLALTGNLAIAPHARGIVVFAHGSGSSRLSPRHREGAPAPPGLYAVRGPGHRCEEPGALRRAISVASVWLRRRLGPPPQEARAEPR